MPTSVKTHSVTVIAAVALATARFVSAAGGYATSSNDVIGASEIAVAAGRACSCVTHYSALVEAGATLADGDYVKPALDGTGRAIVGSDTDACGRVVGGGVAGDLLEVRLMLQFGVREGGGGVGLNAVQVIAAAGVGASIPSLGATRVSLAFSGEVGAVHQAHVMLENAITGAIIGVVYWPSTGARWFDVPGGVTSLRLNTTHWSDAGGTDTINLTVAG